MAAYRRVYDSRHLQADCQEPGSAPELTLGNRVRATFTFLYFIRGCLLVVPVWFQQRRLTFDMIFDLARPL